MTAGNNGSDRPENDDPFAYLYRQEGDPSGQGGQPGPAGAASPRTGGYGYPGPSTPHQPGVPRTSYNHVRAVGERTYGQQVPPQHAQNAQQGYGQQGTPQGYGQPGYGQQNAHYAAPETLPGGAPRRPAPGPQGGGRGGSGGGPNTKGLLIAAVAVVAVVVAGIGIALLTNSSEKKDDQADGGTDRPTAGSSVKPSEEPSKEPGKPKTLPTQDASGLALAGSATRASDIKGAKAKDGTYVAGINTPGASATWSVNVEKPGSYKLYVGYGVPGEDQSLSLTVNGSKEARPLNMGNFAHGPKGDWEKGWTYTYSIVRLNAGTNTVKISCEAGDKCAVNLDQVWLKK
ncbi:carbohydrate-binding protein [Streptomyces sp. P1-3]|uniref:carbohydrate-binding protein n=1 Tax=Streptomyces sp. P1-3 TaxID=3421658 RepID=UPI003D367CBF